MEMKAGIRESDAVVKEIQEVRQNLSSQKLDGKNRRISELEHRLKESELDVKSLGKCIHGLQIQFSYSMNITRGNRTVS